MSMSMSMSLCSGFASVCCFWKKSSSRYEDASWKTTVPYVPDVKEGKVIKVYDGDTITVAAFVPGCRTMYRFSVRLDGIDTPEMKTKNEEEKLLAHKAQEDLSGKVLGEMVELENVSMEKYGRLLATVVHKGVNMNQWMIDQGHAKEYHGGTKSHFVP